MAFAEISYGVAERIATITLNRPEKRNAWSPETEAEVREAFGLAAADPDARAVILTGAGSTFCVGADVTGIAGRRPDRPRFAGVTPSPGAVWPMKMRPRPAAPLPGSSPPSVWRLMPPIRVPWSCFRRWSPLPMSPRSPRPAGASCTSRQAT